METVRCAIFRKNKKGNLEVLVLQKAPDSKNPHALEFPGGKLFDSTFMQWIYKLCPFKGYFQKKQVQREVFEETGLMLPLKKIHYLESKTYKNSATKVKTMVYEYFTMLETQSLKLEINKTLDHNGNSEDKHSGFFWINLNKFRVFCSQRPGRRKPFICKNSRVPMLWKRVFRQMKQPKTS